MCRKSRTTPSPSTTMGCRDIKRKKSERGSITMEAAIFLTLFILFYVAMMDLIQIAKAQVLLQYCINEAAKEISAYSYVLTKAGIIDKRLETVTKAAEVTEVITALQNVGSALTGGNISGALDAVGEAEEKIKNIQVEDIPEDVLSMFKTWAADGVSDFAIQKIVEAEVKKQIGMMSAKAPDQFLRELGIENGMKGLDFSSSEWADESVGDGIPVLKVAVVYTIHFDLGYLELEPRTFKLCAKTALW